MNIFQESIDRIHCKRRSFQALTEEEFAFLLADTILDRGLYSSPNWNLRYGGVRYAPRPLPTLESGKILVLQWPGSMGDACMAAPFLSVLRQRYPNAQISFLSSRAAGEIFSGSQHIDLVMPNPLDPYLDRILSGQRISPEDLLRDVRELAVRLAGEKYELVVNLQILPMSAALARLSGARKTVGMTLSGDGMPVIYGNLYAPYLFGVSANLMRRFNPLHRTELFHLMVDEERNFDPRPAVSISAHAVRRVQEFLDREGIGDHEPLIGLNPMSGTPIRQWPHFDRLAGMLRDKLGARVMIFGSKAEDHEVEAIVGKAGRRVVKATQFTLQELMAAISGCDLFITNDTGPMHLACLLGRKVIALFGPTGFREVGPWQGEFHVLQSSGCRDCFSQKCREPVDYCMNRITVKEVYALAESELKGSAYHHLNRDTSHYTAREGIHPDQPMWHLGHLLLEVFRERGKATVKNDEGPGRGPFHGEDSPDHCSRLKGVVESAIRSFSSQCNGEGANALVKPLIVMNDLEFLEKRVPLGQDLEACLVYYQGLHRDLAALMGLITENRID